MKEQTWDTKGRLISDSDTRTLDEAREAAIQQLRNAATAWIESQLDPFDQVNAALGVLPEAEAAAVKAVVQSAREQYAKAKADVLAASKRGDVDAIRWTAPAALETAPPETAPEAKA